MLQLRQISKQFGAFEALKTVNFSANGGEIVGLLGENGAGKSTLLNLVSGVLRPSSGEMLWQGARAEFSSPRESAARGIGVVYQHGKLVEKFSAGENMALHAQNRGLRIDKKAWNTRVESWAQSLGWRLDASRPVEELSVGEQQRIEILKALFAHQTSDTENDVQNGARLLLLDEPTANLTPDEANELFVVLRRLREQGRSIVFVSHKLHEVMALCDRVVVLRRGVVVGERNVAQTSIDELAHLMIGEAAERESSTRTSVATDAPIRLNIDGVSAGMLHDFSLQVRAGEIVGIAGVDGNGQAELVEVLSRARAAQSGSFRCEKPEDDTDTIAVIPPDRQRVGLIGTFDLAENMALHPELRARCRGRLGFNWKAARSYTRDVMARYDVRAPQTQERTQARHLSGGNQQKLVIARALEFGHGAVVAADPTRGLDIGASRFVHSQLRKAAQNGAAVLLISTDLDEVLALSDRIGVLYEGRLMPQEKLLARNSNGDFDRDVIGGLMGGRQTTQGKD